MSNSEKVKIKIDEKQSEIWTLEEDGSLTRVGFKLIKEEDGPVSVDNMKLVKEEAAKKSSLNIDGIF